MSIEVVHFSKNSKKSFPSSDKRSKGILDLVHSDICGPMLVLIFYQVNVLLHITLNRSIER